MSGAVTDQLLAELHAVLRGLELAAGGSTEQHDRWTRTAALLLGTATDALEHERNRADNLAAGVLAVIDAMNETVEKRKGEAVHPMQHGFLAGVTASVEAMQTVFGSAVSHG